MLSSWFYLTALHSFLFLKQKPTEKLIKSSVCAFHQYDIQAVL